MVDVFLSTMAWALLLGKHVKLVTMLRFTKELLLVVLVKKKESDIQRLKIMHLIRQEQKYLGLLRLGKTPKVGGGSVVLKDVPDNSTVVGIPGRVVMQNGKRVRKI